jgi:pyruvate,phosphate dikinase
MADSGTKTYKAAKRYIYAWGGGKAEGNGGMKDLLGGKGAGLAEMTNAGLPTPPGFTITTEACNDYFAAGKKLPAGLWDDVLAAVKVVEKETGKGFGDPKNPLLVSVRSGAKFSMPGMMDTVLNLGLNETTLAGLIASTGNERFGWDAYRRFIAMFGRIVLGVEGERFDQPLETAKLAHGRDARDTDLDVADLKALVEEYKRVVRKDAGRDFPTDPNEQLDLAIKAVFASWFGKRANDYRNSQKIAHDLGTAVNVVTMVFGNMGNDSGTGVAFTRNPNTGEKVLFGEYLVNAQGEDVVAGIRTPSPIAALAEDMPKAYAEFTKIADKLERHYKDVQDLEFTIERGRLYMLQTRSAKRTATAAVRIAIDMVKEKLITREEAVGRVARYLVNPPQVAVGHRDGVTPLTTGRAASPGVAWGEIVTSPDAAEDEARAGKRVILARSETCPDDFHGMVVAQGILTSTGGTTSHAAVVARELGIPAVVGAGEVEVGDGVVTICGRLFRAGETITIDGSTGEVFAGEVQGSTAIVPEAGTVLTWAKELNIRIGDAGSEAAVETSPAAAAPAPVPAGLAADDVLRGLLIKGLVPPEGLAVALSSPAEKVKPLVDGLVSEGLAETSSDAFRLTSEGKLRALDVFATDRERAGGEEACVAALDRFLLLDVGMKDLVTAWQLRGVGGEQVFNDHSDAAYDASILERLSAIHGGVVDVLSLLGTTLWRMACYRERLERALAAAQAGDQRFVASPRVDSYHSVWFELHEDLIRLSGRRRSDEAAAGRA